MSYTRTYIKSRLNAALKNKIGMLTSDDDVINAGAREAFGETMFRGAKRRVQLSPGLMSDVYRYPAPQDLNGIGIVDVQPNDASQQTGAELILRTQEEFWRNLGDFNCAIDDVDGYKKLLISVPVTDTTLTVAELDALDSGGGTWVAYDTDTNNVRVDTSFYMKGVASLAFDITAVAGTKAGIKNTTLDAFDISDFLYDSVYVWANINSPTDITNYVLEVGSGTSNYYKVTATAAAESIPFQAGANLLRFDMSTKTTPSGVPVYTACTYMALYMTKATTKISETGYNFDHVMFKKGKAYMLTYYTQYPWRSSAGTYLLESTAETDVLICNSDEFDVVLFKIIALAAQEIGEDMIQTNAEAKYKAKREYMLNNNPDESKLIISEYYVF